MSSGVACDATRRRPSALLALDAEHLTVFFLLWSPAVAGLRSKIQDLDLSWRLAGVAMVSRRVGDVPPH